jgi:prepilin-type N-terminal cleavage/methylation domain-containing protein
MLKFVKKNNSKKKGFTLIELMVTLSIFVVVSSVVLFNQSQFNSSVVLTNLSYDVALAIRQAQTFGIGGKDKGFSMGSKPRYGVHIAKGSKNIILFADINKDGVFATSTAADSDKVLEQFKIVRGNSVKEISSVVSNANYADIVFIRPDPDAYIKINGETKVSALTIVLGSDTDSAAKNRLVQVNETGMINVLR